MLQVLVLVPVAAAALHRLQQVEAAEEEDEEHVGDDNEGDSGGIVREFTVPVARALREFAAAATPSSAIWQSGTLALSASLPQQPPSRPLPQPLSHGFTHQGLLLGR